jgi:glycosyltransferase involved in cell wall biosynthesis
MAPSNYEVNVVHLTSGHRADDARIFGKECLTLARAGYRVAIIVPENGTSKRQVDGVEIVPVAHYAGRVGRMVASAISVGITALRCQASVYHFHDPDLIPIGLLLRLIGKRVIYDAHEDVPRDILIKNWIPRNLRRPVSLIAAVLEWFTGRILSGVVAATPVIARRFPRSRTALVQNFADLSEFSVPDGSARRASHAIAYVGSVTAERCAIEMIEAVARIERFPDARLIIAGKIESDTLTSRLAEMEGWVRVDYRGFQSRQGVAGILAEAAAGLAIFHPVQSYIESQPVKMFEYMATGLPVIAADFPRFREIVEGNRCGICVPPRDPVAIATAIEWIFDHPTEAQEMGRRGRSLVLDAFNWEGQERSLLQLYQRVLGEPGDAKSA